MSRLFSKFNPDDRDLLRLSHSNCSRHSKWPGGLWWRTHMRETLLTEAQSMRVSGTGSRRPPRRCRTQRRIVSTQALRPENSNTARKFLSHQSSSLDDFPESLKTYTVT